MNIKCELDSNINLKLLSHFKPDKFEFMKLQKSNTKSSVDLFLSYMKTNVEAFDITLINNEIILQYYEPKNFVNNFGSLSYLKLSEIKLKFDGTPRIDFITENNIEYLDCEIVHIKFENELLGILCKLPGMGNYLIYDVKNCDICILGHDQLNVCKRLMKEL